MINRKSIVNSPDDRLRQFNRMTIPSAYGKTHMWNRSRTVKLKSALNEERCSSLLPCLNQTQTHTHTHTHTHPHTHTHTHTHTPTHKNTDTHTHTHPSIHINTLACLCLSIFLCPCAIVSLSSFPCSLPP